MDTPFVQLHIHPIHRIYNRNAFKIMVNGVLGGALQYPSHQSIATTSTGRPGKQARKIGRASSRVGKLKSTPTLTVSRPEWQSRHNWGIHPTTIDYDVVI